MKSFKKTTNILLKLLETILLLAVLAFVFIIGSLLVLCTKGGSFIFLIPIYLISAPFIFRLFKYIWQDQKSPKKSKDYVALHNYIDEAKKFGLSDDEIRDELVGNDWSELDIDKVLKN